MNVIVIASVVILLTMLFGALLAVVIRGFGRAVTNEQRVTEADRSSINLAVTMGHEIPSTVEVAEQLKFARKIAAQRAAQTPRGANIGIGSVGDDKQPTAFDGVQADPITAVKIAQFHGWEGLRTGSHTATVQETSTAKAPSRTVAPTKGPDDLVPGVDYQFIEINEEMSPAEKRKARIANAKAKSAAVKTIKADGGVSTSVEAVSAQTAGEEQEESTPVPAPIATVQDGQPVAGVDYTVIEINEEMSPDEKRKARIANAKAKSAAMKAYKQSGASATQLTDQEAPISKPAETVIEQAPTTEIPANINIPQPEYIEIKDDMDPAELRKARIHNAKAKSAYNKALKAAGIDPANTVS